MALSGNVRLFPGCLFGGHNRTKQDTNFLYFQIFVGMGKDAKDRGANCLRGRFSHNTGITCSMFT